MHLRLFSVLLPLLLLTTFAPTRALAQDDAANEEYAEEEEAPEDVPANEPEIVPPAPGTDPDRIIRFSDTSSDLPNLGTPTASPKPTEPSPLDVPVKVPPVDSTPLAEPPPPAAADSPLPTASGFSMTPTEPSATPVATPVEPESRRFFEQLIERVRATKQGPSEILIMRAMMERLAYRSNPSMQLRSRLAASLEQLIGPLCMPLVFREFAYFGNPQDPDCKELIKETLEVDPENPLALCASLGLDNERCRNAYEEQVVTVATDLSTFVEGNPIAKAFEESEQTKLRPRIEELEILLGKREGELREMEEKLKSKNPPIVDIQGIKDRIYDIHAHLVTLRCRSSKVSIRERTQDEIRMWETKHAGPTPVRKGILPEQDMKRLGLLSGPVPPTKPVPAYVRIRTMIQDCRNAIDRARRFQPDFATALCAEVGEYSPGCVSALRKAKENRSRSHAATNVPGKTPGRSTPPPVKKDPGTLATF